MDHKPNNSATRTPAPSISALAIVAMVLAVIPCCPPINLLAIALGMLAYRRIGRSGGRLRGATLAQVAIFAGFTLSLFSLFLLGRFDTYYQQRMNEGMVLDLQEITQAAIDQQVGIVQAKWSSTTPDKPKEEAILEFGVQFGSRYGELVRIVIVSQTQSGILKRIVQGAIIFHCTSGQYNGSFQVELGNMDLDFIPEIRLHWLTLEDPDLGNLRLPEVVDPPDTREESEP